MNLYLDILKPLLDYKTFVSYYDTINLDFIDKNYPEVSRLYKCLPLLHSSGEEKQYTTNDLKLVFHTNYPQADFGLYDPLIDKVAESTSDNGHILGFLKKSKDRELALRIAKEALEVSEGRKEITNLNEMIGELEPPEEQTEEWQRNFIETSLSDLLDEQFNKPGLRWRLSSLNKHLGSLRKGNFGFVFARPETGKTTFLADSISHFAEQLTDGSGDILWFNNEEDGGKVRLRLVQATLGCTLETLNEDKDGNNSRFLERTGNRIRLFDDGGLSKRTVEQVCRKYKPSLILFDQLDKIKGFSADRNDLVLKEVYQWARELAKTYGPVIGVCQAGESGENKKYLGFNDVDSSKTAKQGEADWMLGIGKQDEVGKEDIRYFYLSKNKLYGDPDTDKSQRHGRWVCLIEPEIARYRDVGTDGN